MVEARLVSPQSRIQFLAGLPELRALITFFIGTSFVITLWVKGVQIPLSPFTWIVALIAVCAATRILGQGHLTEVLQGLQAPLFKTAPNGLSSLHVAIVTGASSGIGLETVKQLARQNVFVILAVRNPSKMQNALHTICSELKISDQGKYFRVMELNLDSLQSVKNFVENYNKLGLLPHSLAFLVNNAGAMLSAPKLISDAATGQPVDSAFSTNHLGHFLLTCLLFPTLVRSGTRVVSLSSAMHLAFTASTPVTATNTTDAKKWDAPAAYAGGKISNIWFTRALQRRFDRYYASQKQPSQQQATAYAIAPGTVWTAFHMPYYKEFMGGILIWFPVVMGIPSYFSFKSAFEGCQSTLHMLFAGNPRIAQSDASPQVNEKMEKLFQVEPTARPSPGQMHAECRLAPMSSVAADETKAEKHWEYSLQLVQHLMSKETTQHFDLIQ